VTLIEAGHPTPDRNSVGAGEAALALARALGPGDLLLAVLSGGGSSLLALPAPGVGLEEKQAVTRALLAAGASIGEINIVRKHLSAIKGGRLAAAAAPARVETWILSDVPDDDPALVASGPTLPDRSTVEEARAVLTRCGIAAPPLAESPLVEPGAVRILATADDALGAAAEEARARGYAVTSLGQLEGEARALGHSHAALAYPSPRRAILSGGETTVTVRQPGGRGGRNLEYLLGLAIALNGASGVSAIAADTDGIDGTGPAAGAMLFPDTLARAQALGLDPADHLDRNDASSFFEAIGDLVVTGPTFTNVNDFRAIFFG
jgi:hydroxypyruvate reductase